MGNIYTPVLTETNRIFPVERERDHMDKFDKTVDDMSKMTKKEGRELNKELRERCECPACPTYAKCAKGSNELLYCFWGDSDCITMGPACICPSCSVAQEKGLKNRFYCINGPEIAQRQMPAEHIETKTMGDRSML
jgi:hypothetical protein